MTWQPPPARWVGRDLVRCPACAGRGVLLGRICEWCAGRGMVRPDAEPMPERVLMIAILDELRRAHADN